MYIRPHKKTLEVFEGRLLLESSYDSAQILIGGDVITTFHGREACRQHPDDTMLFTVPKWRGLRWIRHFGGDLGVWGTKRKPWRGGVEEHFVLQRAYDNLITAKHVCAQIKKDTSLLYDRWDLDKIYVPDSSVPRRRTLTDVGERQVEDAIEKLANDLTDASVVDALKGTPRKAGHYSIMYEYGFTRLFEARSFEYVKEETIDQVIKAAKKRKYWIADKIDAECEYSKL
jgi:hypothetical protein